MVAAGGALGAVMRYGVAYASLALVGGSFPLGTFVVNATGSFFLGFLAGAAEIVPISSGIRLLVMTGLLGAFTTFSTFSLDTVSLVRSGHLSMAFINVGLNVVVGLVALVAGLAASRLLVGAG